MIGLNEEKTVLVIGNEDKADSSFKNIICQKYNVVYADGFECILELLSRDITISAIFICYNLYSDRLKDIIKKIRIIYSIYSTPIFIVTDEISKNDLPSLADYQNANYISKPFNSKLVLAKIQKSIKLSEIKNSPTGKFASKLLNRSDSDFDYKTGLYNKESFCKYTKEKMSEDNDKNYLIIRWDLDKFKLYNETKGFVAGDKLLADIADICRYIAKKDETLITYGHLEADHFVTCLAVDECDADDIIKYIEDKINNHTENYNVSARCGIYIVDHSIEDVGKMCDRALIALKSIKNDINKKFAFYDNSMLSTMKKEQTMISELDKAIEDKQFKVYLQPQYNYESGEIIGAEGLVRWEHPEKGLIMPNDFIPMFERNNLIPKLDSYVFNEICELQRKLIDYGSDPIPVSVNISRQDIYNTKLCSEIMNMPSKYNIDPSLIRLEITESAYVEDDGQLKQIIEKFRKVGFLIEIDDFGCGYSSLNSLTNINADLIKLDLKFISDAQTSSKSTGVLSAIVRMIHWLNLPVIAEGVETYEQAEYLKSLNCIYMQGFFLSRPITLEEYRELILNNKTKIRKMDVIFSDKTCDYWKSTEQTSILFYGITSGAAIFEYHGDTFELMQSNDQYYDELCISREDYIKTENNFISRISPSYRETFVNMLKNAISNRNQASCEVSVLSDNNRIDPIWISVNARLLAASNRFNYVFFVTIENVSLQKQVYFDCINEINKCNQFIENLDSFLMNKTSKNIVEITESIITSINKSNSSVFFLDEKTTEILYFNTHAEKEFKNIKRNITCSQALDRDITEDYKVFLEKLENHNELSKPIITTLNNKEYLVQSSRMIYDKRNIVLVSVIEIEHI